MNHKRARPRSRRAEPKVSQPEKTPVRPEGRKGESFSDHHRRTVAVAELREVGRDAADLSH